MLDSACRESIPAELPKESRSLLQRSWNESLRALRANILPGFLLQSLMAGMAAAYLWHPGSRRAFEELALLKSNWGLLFSFAGTSLASVILPELLRLLLHNATMVKENFAGLSDRLLFGLIFWGLIGMQVDLFYRFQYFLFGPSSSFSVIVKKVLVDALLYCPILAIPQAVSVFLWRDHGFTLKGFCGHTPLDFYALKILPVLLANWMVWIPIVCLIYAFPPALGIPFFMVAQSFWVLVFSTLSRRF